MLKRLVRNLKLTDKKNGGNEKQKKDFMDGDLGMLMDCHNPPPQVLKDRFKKLKITHDPQNPPSMNAKKTKITPLKKT